MKSRYLSVLFLFFASISGAVWCGPALLSVTQYPLGKLTTRIVELKYSEACRVTYRNGAAMIYGPDGLIRMERRLARFDVMEIHPSFSRSPELLQREKQLAEKRLHRPVADLRLYFRVVLNSSLNTGELLQCLNRMPEIEIAYPVFTPPVPGGTTGDFTERQSYLFSAQEYGPFLARAWEVVGGRGEGVTCVDIEYEWNFFHEDLIYLDPSKVLGGTGSGGDTNHGTAVAGMLIGTENDFGIIGICPEAELKTCYSMFGPEWNVAEAVNIATANTDPGDVILLEQQAYGPNYTGNGQLGLVPVEHIPAVYDAIETAVGLGRVVVESAGNGKENLDDYSVYGDEFNPDIRDSGAIIVGAGTPFSRLPESHATWGTNTGRRIDLHAWGDSICTTGFGDMYNGGSNALYTANFSGTSGAAAMVAGAVVCFQGIALRTADPPDPAAVRDILCSTGIPQASGNHIGPLPDIGAAIQMLQLPTPPPDQLTVDLSLNAARFTTGDPFVLKSFSYNPFVTLSVSKCLVLGVPVSDEMVFYFWPDWTETPYYDWMFLQPGTTVDQYLNFPWPADAGTGSAVFYIGYFNPENAELIAWDGVEFCWIPE